MAQLSSQQFLEIEDIREGVVILKNKSLRGVIKVFSLNFDLKSEEEQAAIIYQFQSFLNSLDFPIQILIQSKRVNLTAYLDKLKNLEKEQENKLLRYQISEYRKFITDLVKEGEIFTKDFFIIVPFQSLETSGFGGKSPSPALSEERFQLVKMQLLQRMDFVAQGLRRCGLNCVYLNSRDLIELCWSLYHPAESEIGYYPEIPPELLK